MENDKKSALLKEIGELMAEDREYPLDGTLLRAVVGDNVISISIFKDRDNLIVYRRPNYQRMSAPFFELWEMEEPGKRWSEMEYLVKNGRFETVFVYPDEIDPNEEPLDRRARIVRRYFGEKPIVYPPWSDDADIQQFDL